MQGIKPPLVSYKGEFQTIKFGFGFELELKFELEFEIKFE